MFSSIHFASAAALIPGLLGVFVVLQAGMNRRISVAWGLPSVALLNAVVLFVAAGALLFFVQAKPQSVSSLFQARADLASVRPWFIVPGLLGLLIVLGGAWSVARFGAMYTFVVLLSSQLATSVAWDLAVEGQVISKQRLLGVVLAWAGVVVASWRG
jgi:uncharacterized membrane protein YdcZ (DUF606 family)